MNHALVKECCHDKKCTIQCELLHVHSCNMLVVSKCFHPWWQITQNYITEQMLRISYAYFGTENATANIYN